MNKLYILDPTQSDKISAYRGGGRIIQLLKENFPDAEYVDSGCARSSLTRMTNENNSTLLIPSWNPFFPPFSVNNLIVNPSNPLRTCKKYLIIFDVIPIKYSGHFPIGLKGKFNLWRNKQNLNNFDKIITISETSKKDLVKYLHIPENKIGVIYPCLSEIFVSQNSNVKSQIHNLKLKSKKLIPTNYCLYVGDVNWNKNLVNIARAIKIASVPCIFAGKSFSKVDPQTNPGVGEILTPGLKASQLNHPWQKEFKDFLIEVGDDKRFIFLDYVSDIELIKLYQNAKCNVLISRDEGFGMGYIEAGSQGCPSVLSDIPVFHEIAKDNCLYADPENPQSIADQITKIFGDIKLRDQLGQQAKKYVLDKYSPERFRVKLNSLI